MVSATRFGIMTIIPQQQGDMDMNTSIPIIPVAITIIIMSIPILQEISMVIHMNIMHRLAVHLITDMRMSIHMMRNRQAPLTRILHIMVMTMITHLSLLWVTDMTTAMTMTTVTIVTTVTVR